MNCDRCRDVVRGAGAGALWSVATAREIVQVIAEDVEVGLVAPDQAIDLIDRVRSRAKPALGSPKQGVVSGEKSTR